MEKTVTSNDVFSPSWYKNQVTKKLLFDVLFLQSFFFTRGGILHFMESLEMLLERW